MTTMLSSDAGSEQAVEQPIAALPQQVACRHRLQPAQVRLGNSIDGGESGGQYPRRRNEHPGLKRLKALIDAHPSTLAQEPPANKKNGRIDGTLTLLLTVRVSRDTVHV